MIDKLFVICLGSLVAALPFAVWIAIDWYKIRPWLTREKWQRVAHYFQAYWRQELTEREARALVYVCRGVWVWMLVVIAMKGW
jgi:hypothetical protein